MSSVVRTGIFASASLGIVGLMALMAWALSNQAPVTGMSGFTRVGEAAPDFTLRLFDGDELTLSDLAGSPLVINIWVSWCTRCREEAAGLELSRQICASSGSKRPQAILGVVPDGQAVSKERCKLVGIQRLIEGELSPAIIREVILDMQHGHG